jgi:hypothetical protein
MLKRLAYPEKNAGGKKIKNMGIIKIHFANVGKFRCFGTTLTN